MSDARRPASSGIGERRTIRLHRRLAALCAATVSLIVLILVVGQRVAGGHVFAFDRLILLGLRADGGQRPIGPAWLTDAMIDITALGGIPILFMISLFAIGLLLAAKRYATATFVAVSIGAGALATRGLKLLIERTRPDLVEHLVPVGSASFPSSHAMNSALVFLTLAALVAEGRTEHVVRVYLIASAVLLTLLVGISRVYLGVHWPSDVLAGWSIGTIWALLSLSAFKAWRGHRTA